MKYSTIVLFSALLSGCDVGFSYIAKPEHGDLMRETLRKVEKCESIGMDAHVFGGWLTQGNERALYYKVTCREKTQ